MGIAEEAMKCCKQCLSQKAKVSRKKRHYQPKLSCPDCRKVEFKNRLKIRVEEFRTRIIDYLKEHPCVDCGTDDIVVLEFDHVRGQKEFNIGTRAGDVREWHRVVNEIEKCEVRCANCHRRKTSKEHNNYRWRVSSCEL